MTQTKKDPQSNPWHQSNWSYEGLLPVFMARFEAEHQAKESELQATARRRPYVLAVIFIVAFLLADRGCAIFTADDPIPYGHYVAGLVVALIAMVIGGLFMEPGSDDDKRRRFHAFFDRLFEDAHPKSPIQLAVVGDPDTGATAWKTSKSPYSGATKKYYFYCKQRTCYGFRNGGQAHVEVWRAVKLKSGYPVRDAHQYRIALRFPPRSKPPSAASLNEKMPPDGGWTFVAKQDEDGGLTLLAQLKGKPEMLQEQELNRLLSWLNRWWAS